MTVAIEVIVNEKGIGGSAVSPTIEGIKKMGAAVERLGAASTGATGAFMGPPQSSVEQLMVIFDNDLATGNLGLLVQVVVGERLPL